MACSRRSRRAARCSVGHHCLRTTSTATTTSSMRTRPDPQPRPGTDAECGACVKRAPYIDEVVVGTDSVVLTESQAFRLGGPGPVILARAEEWVPVDTLVDELEGR